MHGRALALAVALSLGGVSCAPPRSAGSPTPARSIPSRGLFVTSVAHFDRLLGDERKRPTVVNVWASWCIPCRREIPVLREAAQRHAGKVRYLGLNTQDTEDEARAFIKDFSIPYPNAYDPDGKVMRHLRVLGLPTTFFYRRDGKLALVHSGEIDAAALERRTQAVLDAR